MVDVAPAQVVEEAVEEEAVGAAAAAADGSPTRSNTTGSLSRGPVVFTLRSGANMTRSMLILVVGLALMSTTVVAEENSEDAFDRGFELYSQGRFKEAEVEYRKALKEYPQSIGANLELGRLLRETDRPKEALPFLNTARELAPTLAAAYLELGTAHVALKDWDKAEENLKKASKLDGKDAFGWWRLGYVYMQKEKWSDAEKSLKRSLRLDDDIAEAWLDLGMVQRKTGKGEDALISLRKSVETDPSLTAAFEEYASAVEELGSDIQKKNIKAWKAYQGEKYGEAERGIRSLLEGDPENFRSHILLGHILLHQSPAKPADAVAAFEGALTLEKKAKRSEKLPFRSKSLVLEGIGIAHLLLKDTKMAKDAFARGVRTAPEYAGHFYYLAVVAAREGKETELFRKLNQVREKDHDGSWVKRAMEDEEFKIYQDRKTKGFIEALEGK
jgi:tetratricopeptide (TPR) repeat protein